MKTFTKNNILYKAVRFTDNSSIEEIEYIFADFIIDDVLILPLGKKKPEFLVIQAGTSFDNHDGTWTHDYNGTLYVFENDWLMCDGKKLIVVNSNYIKEFEEKEVEKTGVNL